MLIVLDGWGYREAPEHNAVYLAKTPHFDHFLKNYPWTTIEGSGPSVGLPEGVMGNSEVGHMNLGAGRIVRQGLSLIFGAIEDGSFFKNPALFQAIHTAKKMRSTLHLMGLLSDAGVHSHHGHLYALLELAKREGLSQVAVHCFMDGRDTAPTSGEDYLKDLERQIKKIGVGQIATVHGRYYAMDRDKRWERIRLSYEALTQGRGNLTQGPAPTVASKWYETKNPQPGFGDEFIPPTVLTQDKTTPLATLRDGDAVIFYNFRADRAREMTQVLTDPDFKEFSRKKFPKLAAFACMMEYDKKFNLPVAFKKTNLPKIFGKIISDQGLTQLRIAETEKYAHVTFFFNGGEENAFPGEERLLIQSPRDVPTYDLRPEMSAYEVTEAVIRALNEDRFDVIILNFANPDMVGHTAIEPAVIKAVEVVDTCLGRIIPKVLEKNGVALVIADHGNCEEMVDKNGHPHTQHTLNPVPCILISDRPDLKKALLKTKGGKLCDVAPTLLQILWIKKPSEMTGESLIKNF